MNLFFLWGESDQILEVKKAKCWWKWSLTGWGRVQSFLLHLREPQTFGVTGLSCASSASASEQAEHCAPMGADFGRKLVVSYGRFPLFSLEPPCSNTSQKTLPKTWAGSLRTAVD